MSKDPPGETVSAPPGGDAGQQPIPESLEYFRVGKVLGEGGMGTVYLAEDTRLGRPVALKTLKRELAVKPGAKDRFLREARSAARLEHDHIIPIYYVGEAGGTPFLAMPFLQGEPLDARLRRVTSGWKPRPGG
jgi:serine/threonine protein kinase